MSRRLKPLGSKVYLTNLRETKMTSELIIVDGKHRDEKPTLLGDVSGVGPLVRDVMVGDTVLIEGYRGKWVDRPLSEEQDTERFIFEDEILALIHPVGKEKVA